MPRPLLVVLALLACAVPAGCGAATPTSATTSATTAPEPTVPPGPVSTAASTTTTASTAAAGRARCVAADLSAAEHGGEAGLGNRSTVYLLTNEGAAPCRLDGYPGMAFLSATGRVLQANVARGSSYLFNDPGPSEVELGLRGSASFALGWSVPNGRACAWSATVEITPPDDRDHLTIPSKIAVCPGEEPTVSAVVPGAHGPR